MRSTPDLWACGVVLRVVEPSHSGMLESSWTEASSDVSGSIKGGTESQSHRRSPRSELGSESDTSEESQVLSSREPSAVPRSRSRMSSGLPRGHSHHSQRPHSVASAPVSPLVQRCLPSFSPFPPPFSTAIYAAGRCIQPLLHLSGRYRFSISVFSGVTGLSVLAVHHSQVKQNNAYIQGLDLQRGLWKDDTDGKAHVQTAGQQRLPGALLQLHQSVT